jgi:hypothetical protein
VKYFAFLILWLSLLAPRASLAELDAVRDLWCSPDNPSFDNGRVINEAIASGRVRDTLHFPGGVYYHTTPIKLNRDSLALTGQGMARRQRAAAMTDTCAAIFRYVGPSELPAWQISGYGISLRGINIFKSFYPDKPGPREPGLFQPALDSAPLARLENPPPSALPPPPSVAMEWRDWGRRTMEQCSFAGGWDIDLLLASSNHNDCSTLTNVQFGGRVCIRGEESQASGLDLRGIWVNSPGDVFCELVGDGTREDRTGGGNWNFSTLVLNEERLLLRLATGANTCTFEVDNFKVDNNAKDWRLVELTKPGPLNLRVRGHIGQLATPAADAINAAAAASPHLDARLWWKGKLWPEEFAQ